MSNNRAEIVRSRSTFSSRIAAEFVNCLRLAGEQYQQGLVDAELMAEESSSFIGLYGALVEASSPSRRKYLEDAVNRQLDLTPTERSIEFGRLSTINLDKPGVFSSESFLDTLVSDENMGRLLTAAIDGFADEGKSEAEVVDDRGFTSLEFRLSRVKVISTEDWTGADEVQLTFSTIDETGDVGKASCDVGSLNDGQMREWSPPEWYARFNILEGGPNFPKVYAVTLSAFDRDGGGWNKFVDISMEIAKKWVRRYIDEQAGGHPLTWVMAKVLSDVIDSVLDSIFDWLKNVFHDDDDFISLCVYRVTLHNYGGGGDFKHSNGSETDWIYIDYRGDGAHYNIRSDWKLGHHY